MVPKLFNFSPPNIGGGCRCFWLIACAVSLLAAGCKPSEDITAYDVFKADTQGSRPLNRMLVALYFRPDNLWTFKLIGPEAKVAEEEPAFKEFLATVHFAANDNPTLNKLPNWHEEKPEGSFARFTVGPKDDGVELTVSKVNRDKAQNVTILANVNRWRRQLDLSPIGIDDLETFAKPFDFKDGEKFVLVDLKGPGSGKTAAGGMMFPGGPKKPASDLLRQNQQVSFDTPNGWVEVKDDGAAKPFAIKRAATLEVRDGESRAIVTIIPMGKMAGSLLDNVNRWANTELGLDKFASEKELWDNKKVTKLEVGNATGYFVDLIGQQKGVPTRTLAVMVPLKESTWFIKMMGQPDLVGRQKTAFEGFARSVQFPGGR